jgi:hypothetical protein
MEVKILRKGVNGISCAKLAPLGDCWLGVYSRIFLKSYEQKFLNFFEKSLNFSSHYYVMVHIKTLLKICHCQKNSSPF